MNYKKILAVILSLLVVFSLTACKGNEDTPVTQESTTLFNNVTNETVPNSVLNTEAVTVNATTDTTVAEQTQATTQEEISTYISTEAIPTQSSDDPSGWSTERIVEEYKKAASKSSQTAKSSQLITLKDISINNGEYDKAISFVIPIIGKFLESNSTEKEGITGGFENLVPGDVSSAKAYKNGNDTVIEMVMVEQTSGPKDDALSGSVGHAITAVGDISLVIKDLADKGLPLELSEEETTIYYTNPTVKVTLNDNGEIISGTWNYTVKICMNNFKAFGQNVEKATITMDNTITV